ncbi:MAG: PIG-L family deacetylase [Actinomycetota bacterium]
MALETTTPEKILVVSPHFDDAVLSCGQLLGAHSGSAAVVTVFGGKPPAYPSPPTDWDLWGGFAEGDDIVAMRRVEDFNALEVLGTSQRYLDFLDWQYADDDRPTLDEIVPAIEAVVREIAPDRVFLPLGIGSNDHVLTSEACLIVTGRRDGPWSVYEDALYRKQCPDLTAERLLRMSSIGEPESIELPGAPLALKRKSLGQYVSQMKVLGGLVEDDAYAPERYWRFG